VLPDRHNNFNRCVYGQYTSGWVAGEKAPSYREEEGVPDDSRNDTYAAMKLEIDNWRWAGTPFYIRTGKRLAVRSTEIAVNFRPVPHLPFLSTNVEGATPNQLIFSIQPNEGATLQIQAKVPGSAMSIRPVRMDFQYGAAFMSESPEAYERL